MYGASMNRVIHILLVLILFLSPWTAYAQDTPAAPSFEVPWGLLFVVVTPLVLILVTSFLKISVVLSFLRNALGSPQIPPTSAIVAISVILSAFVMAPVALDTGRAVDPFFAQGTPDGQAVPWTQWSSQDLSPEQSVELGLAAAKPLQAWLTRHSGSKERGLFVRLGQKMLKPEDQQWTSAESLLVVVPAFVLTELKEAFLIGFVLFIPFLVLDLVIASILLSLNLQTLNPTQISLPCKLLLFVLMDGWTLLTQGLVLGYV